MMKHFVKLSMTVLCLAFTSLSAVAMTKDEINSRWEKMTVLSELRRAEAPKAEALKAELNSGITRESLYTLWKKSTGSDPSKRLEAAWSILKGVVPGGDVARWNEVNYLELPSQTPRPLMVIDALYTALIELPRREGGVWLAAELLKDFARSSRGRYEFLGDCPAPVAEAVQDIVSRTGMLGNWKPRQVRGALPIADGVSGAIPEYAAMDGDMTFLDNAACPAASGMYAWDRETGRIYRVMTDPTRFLIP